MNIPFIKLKCGAQTGRDGRVIKLVGRKFTLGRDGCSIRTPRESVSRKHVSLRLGPRGWFVTDLESRNGTFVNGERVLETALKVGDNLHLSADGAVYRIVGIEDARNGANGESIEDSPPSANGSA